LFGEWFFFYFGFSTVGSGSVACVSPRFVSGLRFSFCQFLAVFLVLSVLGIVSWGDFLLFANFWYIITDRIFVDDNCGHGSVKATNCQFRRFS
jgi:hypothetical protein